MIRGDKVLGLITARGGSKGVPGKNIRALAGKPLMYWTIEAAKASKYLDRLILSSDDDAIIEVARSYGCDVPFKRDARLATDRTPSMEVVLDALDRCTGYEWIVLLQPTSPLRMAEDIDAAIEKTLALGAPACVTVCEANESPYWMYTMRDDAYMTPLLPTIEATRRQDLPSIYVLNGAVYVARVDWIRKSLNFVTRETVAHVMSKERSVDIDNSIDFVIAQSLMERR